MLKALIIAGQPDEALQLQLLLKQQTAVFSSLRIATGIEEARVLIRRFQPQLVFQEIEMREQNGIDFLLGLEDRPFEVIFIAADKEESLRAIRMPALDYLLKPVHPEELKNAVNRFLNLHQQREQINALLKATPGHSGNGAAHSFRLTISAVNGVAIFPVEEIIRLEGEGNYTRFHLADGKKILSAKTLKEYEELLAGHAFLRIHKSHLVNKKFITRYLNAGTVVLSDKTVLPVSRNRKAEVAAALRDM